MQSKTFLPAVLIAVRLLSVAVSSASAQITISGAGATFPSNLYAKWFEAYGKVDPSVQFTYDASGSGAGRRLIVDQAVDFGASDAPMSDEDLARAPRKILHIPTVAGAVVISFNLSGIGSLKLDGATLAAIFLGEVTQWNDPQIARLNPGLKLPDLDIVVVHRKESSGTTFVFSDYMSDVSPEWKNQVGAGTMVQWPVGLGASGNEGVSAKVKETPGSIGYLELFYVRQNQLPFAEIKNRQGYYVKASLDSVTEALATATIPDDFRFSMVNAPGSDAYPIAAATWLLIYEKSQDPATGTKLIEFLRWAETDGQKMAGDLSFAPLPDSLRKRVLDLIGSLKP
jgi:phosphate transport system substrate-binding protein